MIAFFIGAIGNGIMSKVLKKILKHERPEELQLTDMKLKPSDNGMPSSHAMSLGFICTYTALSLPGLSVPLALYTLCSLYYRVKINLHTTEQVLAGLVLGVTNSILWKSLTAGTSPFLPSVNVARWVSAQLLPPDGILPIQYLAIPALIGLAVVGSFERRIVRFLEQRKNGDQTQKIRAE